MGGQSHLLGATRRWNLPQGYKARAKLTEGRPRGSKAKVQSSAGKLRPLGEKGRHAPSTFSWGRKRCWTLRTQEQQDTILDLGDFGDTPDVLEFLLSQARPHPGPGQEASAGRKRDPRDQKSSERRAQGSAGPARLPQEPRWKDPSPAPSAPFRAGSTACGSCWQNGTPPTTTTCPPPRTH